MKDELDSVQKKIDTAVGMITVASLGNPEVSKAKQILIDASLEIDQLFEQM